jgi:hypothetical protein
MASYTKLPWTMKKNAITMVVNKKSIKIDGMPVYDNKLIYTRIIGLEESRDVNIKEVLTYQFSPVPPALFDENGDMSSQAKTTLKSKLYKLKYIIVIPVLQMKSSMMVVPCYGVSIGLQVVLSNITSKMSLTDIHQVPRVPLGPTALAQMLATNIY